MLLGGEVVIRSNLLRVFVVFGNLKDKARIRLGFFSNLMVMWSVWKARNALIFSRKMVTVEQLVNKIKLSLWKWFLCKNSGYSCIFYKWEVDLSGPFHLVFGSPILVALRSCTTSVFF